MDILKKTSSTLPSLRRKSAITVETSGNLENETNAEGGGEGYTIQVPVKPRTPRRSSLIKMLNFEEKTKEEPPKIEAGFIEKEPISHFCIRHIINFGRFGTWVVISSKSKPEKLYQLKFFAKSSLSSGSDSFRAESEAKVLNQTLSELDCSYLVKGFGNYQSEHCLYFLSEFESGGDLKSVLQLNQVLCERDVRIITKQISSALKTLHDSGIVHRDVRLENIRLSGDGKQVKLSNFELCKYLQHLRRSSSLSNLLSPSGSGTPSLSRKARNWGTTSTNCGSPTHRAPEIIEGKEYGLQVDSWALGVIVYELFSGHLPFHNPASVPQTIELILRNRPDYTPLSDECFEFCSRLFVHDPKRRMEIGSAEFIRNPFLVCDEVELSPNLKRVDQIDYQCVLPRFKIRKISDPTRLDGFIDCNEEVFSDLCLTE